MGIWKQTKYISLNPKMSKKPDKKGDTKSDLNKTQEFAPPRAPIEKPKKTVKEILAELEEVYERKEGEYFTPEMLDRYKKNFELFDRNNDAIITLEELKELLVSVNIVWDDMEMLEALYNELQKQNALYDNPGINFEDFKKILAKKKKDEDYESDLIDAFKFLHSCRKPPGPEEDVPEERNQEPWMNSEEFRDWLVYNGYRYNEDQADAFMSECDPKKDGWFNFEDFVTKKLVKRDVKKKGKGMRKGK